MPFMKLLTIHNKGTEQVVMVDKKKRKGGSVPVSSLGHVAIAVPDLDIAMNFYKEHFGCEVSEPVVVDTQLIRMAYVHLGDTNLELMEPIGEESPISKFIERNPNGGIHHICLRVPEVSKAADGARRAGLRILSGEELAKGYEGQDLFFLHPKDTFGTLIEIE